MKPLPLRFSHQFHAQIIEIVDYYDREAGEPTAKSFLEALQTALDRIAENPRLGSLFSPALHQKFLNRFEFYKIHLNVYSSFPYTIFYCIEKQHVMIHVIHHQSANHDILLKNAF